MEVLDDLDFTSEDARETGDIDQFNQKLIPLQRNSYLGQFPWWSKLVSVGINEGFSTKMKTTSFFL